MALEAEVRAKGAAKLGAMQAELGQAQVRSHRMSFGDIRSGRVR